MTITLEPATIENFKAVDSVTIPLSPGLTVLVGQNSSGKSSILQALHWACRCVAHPKVVKNQSRSIDVNEFDYFPTQSIRAVGHNKLLRQIRKENEEVSVRVRFKHYAGGSRDLSESLITIGHGNNEVLKVNLKDENGSSVNEIFYRELTNAKRLFSTYIPGLAGISPFEEKRSSVPVLRQAASGDANTVLRNILVMIDSHPDEKNVNLEKLSNLCSRVLGPTEVRVNFEDSKDFRISAVLRTESMMNGHWVPLEMAGTGVLQCIQIFAYILLYNPMLLLIDEPDAHLHPDRQEGLVQVLSEITELKEISVVMTTHSPNVVRALPPSCNLIWLREGKVVTGEEDVVRKRMGWGLLDKSILLISEDNKTVILKSIIEQWPDISRAIAIWPVNGHSQLPNLESCKTLLNITGMKCLVLHRDSDFMTPDEKNRLIEKYRHSNISLWMTEFSDIEAEFLDPKKVALLYGLDQEEVEKIYVEIENENEQDFLDTFGRKRQLIAEDRRIYSDRKHAPGAGTAKNTIPKGPYGIGHFPGKDFASRLKQKLNARKLDAGKLLRAREYKDFISPSLYDLLCNMRTNS